MSDAPTFDRDATKEALPVVAQALMNGGIYGAGIPDGRYRLVPVETPKENE